MDVHRRSVGNRLADRCRLRILALWMPVALEVLSVSAFGQSPAPPEFRVSLPDIKLSPREGIAEFQCDIRSATIEQVTKLPNGWTFEIANDNSDIATIRAHSIVGAAFLRNRDISYFKNFMVIQMDYPPNSLEGPPFSIDFRVGITNDPDDTAVREQHFSTREILLTPVGATLNQ